MRILTEGMICCAGRSLSVRFIYPYRESFLHDTHSYLGWVVLFLLMGLIGVQDKDRKTVIAQTTHGIDITDVNGQV